MNHRKNESGFTLVELMVVVAIVGILSAVAIPNFKRYQAKSKTSEAKLQLSAIYSALTSLQADYDAFATCLEDAGYVAPKANNYYSVGFGAENATANGIIVANGGTCTAGKFQFPNNKKVGGWAINQAAAVAQITVDSASNAGGFSSPSVDDNGSFFLAGAIGAVSTDSTSAASSVSQWTIDENKSLTEVVKGY
ncbi:fimbrial family protein [Bacteriovorax sp. BSW11_IV]|uniref:type IV pilin protein n=1 Tax=Bacteriovorax sp. BSW11_IV TaxID=1353529 RepID=UPI00038A3791|nr:type II secretion system protein [Bacteriovorax sp. BSW11_IV]EQC47068.1 fimbrial family protein [Bacteriovorax sp. BSW11_IV]